MNTSNTNPAVANNFGDYVYFGYLGNYSKYGFKTYTDPVTGQAKGYVIGYDKDKNPIYKKWQFTTVSQRQIRVSTTEEDKLHQKAVDFLRGCPDCYGSPNGEYVNGTQIGIMFKEVNEKRDAELATNARMVLLEAQNKAAALQNDHKGLTEFAALIGVYNEDDAIKFHRVLDYASNYPEKFLALYSDESRAMKAIVSRAINAKVFEVDGKIIKWEGKVIGADQNEAISRLLSDQELARAVELNLKQFGA